MSKRAKLWCLLWVGGLMTCLTAANPHAISLSSHREGGRSESGAYESVAGDRKTDIRGLVTKQTPSNDQGKKSGLLGVILIEGEQTKDTGYDKASVKVTDKTVIKKLVGKDRKDAKYEELKQGCKVEANFTGPVMESYPVQATAKEIVILEDAK